MICKSIEGFVGLIKIYGWGYFEGDKIVDFGWFSKVLSLLKVVHMIREMG